MQLPSWGNSRVLITGSSGFVGSQLAADLQKKGARVAGLSRHPKDPSWEKRVDVTRKSDLVAFVRSFDPHVCFHLASVSLVESGATRPHATFQANIEGALNILEACRSGNVRRIVIASSSHVYGAAPSPYSEDEPARPSRPYETSKACIDLIAQSYADSFHLPVLIPRFVNIYGPGDMNFSRIVPKTMRSVIHGKNPELWGGSARRQYLYIDDAVSAYEAIARISDTQLERNRTYNIGSDDAISVRDLVRAIMVLSADKLQITPVASAREEEISEQIVTWRKVQRTIRWGPQIRLEEGLKTTYAWYTNYFVRNMKGTR